jgi:phage terminase small subunit
MAAKKVAEKAPNGLTTKQRAFVAEYLSNGFNATRAALAAGYSKKTAYSIGAENLKKPEIAAEIARGLEEHGITAESLKVLLGEVAWDTDVADFEPWLRGEKTLEELRAAGVNTSLVKTARVTERGARSIELHDRMAAVKELARVLGLVTKKHEVTARSRMPDLSSLSDEELERRARMINLRVLARLDPKSDDGG